MLSKVCFDVYASNLPIKFEIFDSNWCKIFSKNINVFHKKFCIELCNVNGFFVVATHNGIKKIRFIKLQNQQCLFLKMAYNFADSDLFLQNFLLLDENYDMPIKNAVLRFE